MYRLCEFWSHFPEYQLTPIGKMYNSRETAIQALIQFRMGGNRKPIMLCDECLYPVNSRAKRVISKHDDWDWLDG